MEAAILMGLGFGAISTLVPLLCRSMNARVSGTLYALSKVGCMAISTVWMSHAAAQLQAHAGGNGGGCVGDHCYQGTYVFILGVSLPLASVVAIWALQSYNNGGDSVKTKKTQ